MIMPRPLSGCQIKAEIKGFLLRHRLLFYQQWFLPNFDLKRFPDSPFTPCNLVSGLGLNRFSKQYSVPGQVRLEQVGKYIDNLQDRKLGSANSVWSQVQVSIGSANTVQCQVRLGLNRQNSILINYKIESQVQQIVNGVTFRSNQVQ